jgi:hypothetical protein
MTSSEIEKKYEQLSAEEKKSFDLRMQEFAATMLNPNQGPYDNAHWHKVPPSPIVEVSGEKSATESSKGSQAVVFPRK